MTEAELQRLVDAGDLEALKAEALRSVATIYDEPRLAQAAFKVAEACEQLTREESVVVLSMTLISTLTRVPPAFFIEAISVIALSQTPPPSGAIAWAELARAAGVKLTARPHVV